MLATHQDIIRRIRICFGVDAETFEHQALSAIRALAGYVLNLPTPPGAYFAEPGGMFELATEVAFYSLQGTDAHIFAGRSTITARRVLEPRWRLATFLAGLCCTLEEAATQAVVEDFDGVRWPALRQPLAEWAAERARSYYRLSWRPEEEETLGGGLLVVSQVIPAQILQYLDEGNDEILPALLESIGGLPRFRAHTPLRELVRRSLALSISQARQRRQREDPPVWSQAEQRIVLDAMRRLAATDARWAVSREKSRVWRAADGLYLVWPAAGLDVIDSLEGQGLAGMPQTPDDLLQLLLAAGTVRASTDEGYLTESIAPPGSASTVEAIRLRSDRVLYPGAVDSPSADAQIDPTITDCSAPAEQDSPADAGQEGAPRQEGGAPDSARPPAPQEAIAAQVVAASNRALEITCPLRLDRAIAAALVDIVSGAEAAWPDPRLSAEGLAIPVDAFRAYGVEPQLALRALDAAGMLVRQTGGRPKIVEETVNGESVRMVTITARFVSSSSTPTGEPAC